MSGSDFQSAFVCVCISTHVCVFVCVCVKCVTVMLTLVLSVVTKYLTVVWIATLVWCNNSVELHINVKIWSMVSKQVSLSLFNIKMTFWLLVLFD